MTSSQNAPQTTPATEERAMHPHGRIVSARRQRVQTASGLWEWRRSPGDGEDASPRNTRQKLACRVVGEVPDDVRAMAGDTVRWLRGARLAEHSLEVLVTTTKVYRHADGTCAFVAFAWPPRGPQDVQHVAIYVAGGCLPLYEAQGCTRAHALTELRDLLLREFVHYQQWADGAVATRKFGVWPRVDLLRAQLEAAEHG